jgi:hypothetical protein
MLRQRGVDLEPAKELPRHPNKPITLYLYQPTMEERNVYFET